MTREEAAKWIREHDEAMRTALKALEQEPVLDKILDKIIEEIEEYRRKTECLDPYVLVEDCINIIYKYKIESEEDGLDSMLENLWNATVEDLWNATESEDWCDIPSDEMTFEQAKQAVKCLRKKLADISYMIDRLRYMSTSFFKGMEKCLQIIDDVKSESEDEE